MTLGRLAALLTSFLVGAGLTAAVLSLESARWRFDLMRHKALGRMGGVSWAELVTDMGERDPSANRSLWVNSAVRYVRDGHPEPCPVEWRGPLGRFFAGYNAHWDLLWMANKYMGLSSDAQASLTPTVEPGDVVIEAGAWVGNFTRHALARQAKLVVAIEPAPMNAECFRRNFEAELAEGRVELVEAAAWSSAGELEMQKAGPNNPHSSNEGYNVVENGEITVRAVTIDEIVRDLELERVDVMNLDIEGAERHALSGARETIRKFAPQIVVCIHHLDDDEEAILALMREIRPEYVLRYDRSHARFDPQR